MKDLCQLLDQKVSVADVNSALAKIETELADCVTIEKLKEVTDD